MAFGFSFPRINLPGINLSLPNLKTKSQPIEEALNFGGQALSTAMGGGGGANAQAIESAIRKDYDDRFQKSIQNLQDQYQGRFTGLEQALTQGEQAYGKLRGAYDPLSQAYSQQLSESQKLQKAYEAQSKRGLEIEKELGTERTARGQLAEQVRNFRFSPEDLKAGLGVGAPNLQTPANMPVLPIQQASIIPEQGRTPEPRQTFAGAGFYGRSGVGYGSRRGLGMSFA